MESSMWCARGARGDNCPMSIHRGSRPTTTSVVSSAMERGRRFMIGSACRSARRPEKSQRPASASSTASPSRGLKKGDRGYDAGKKTLGRKRHVIVDTLGLILALVVHPANIQDRDGARLLIRQLGTRFRRLQVIFADGGYAGKFVHWAKGWHFRVVQIVKRTTLTRFVVLPKRRIVERTFAWLGKYRRLSKDYKTLPECSEAMIL